MIPPAAIQKGGLRPRMRIVGSIDGAPFRSSLIPRGGGTLFVVVPGPLREKIGKSAGESVEISLSVDPRPEVLKVPTDFRGALGSDRALFDRLAPSHRKAFIVWIEGAKQAETRSRRIAQAVQMVRHGQTRN
jgi:hypothetical protein